LVNCMTTIISTDRNALLQGGASDDNILGRPLRGVRE
jgi:hypothetical protein